MRFTNLLREEKGWLTRSTTTHFADKHLAVLTELVQTPTNSEPRPWTTVRRKAAVVIAPQTADGKFVLIKEERVPIRAAIWSMPAGQIDDNIEPNEKEIESGHGRARYLKVSRIAGNRNVKAVSRASGRPAVDGRENGDRASPGDDRLFRLSFNARASHSGAASRSRSTNWCPQSAGHYRLACDFVSPRVLRRHRL